MMRMASDHDEEHEHNDDDVTDLGDEELGDPLGEAPLFRRENHLQHVTWIETLVVIRIFRSRGMEIIRITNNIRMLSIIGIIRLQRAKS